VRQLIPGDQRDGVWAKPVAEEIIGGEALLQSVSGGLMGADEGQSVDGLLGFAETLLRAGYPGLSEELVAANAALIVAEVRAEFPDGEGRSPALGLGGTQCA
jgi:hypothetical protein